MSSFIARFSSESCGLSSVWGGGREEGRGGGVEGVGREGASVV